MFGFLKTLTQAGTDRRIKELEKSLRGYKLALGYAKAEVKDAIDDLRKADDRASHAIAALTRFEREGQVIIGQYELSLAELRAQAVVDQTSIRTLEAANRTHLARYDAETKIQTRRRIAAEIPNGQPIELG